MKAKAIYVGSRTLCYEEKLNAEGKKIPAFDGKEYVFCWIERNDDKTLRSNFGYTLSDRRAKGELITDIEEGMINIGDMVDIDFDIYNIAQRRFVCRYDE